MFAAAAMNAPGVLPYDTQPEAHDPFWLVVEESEASFFKNLPCFACSSRVKKVNWVSPPVTRVHDPTAVYKSLIPSFDTMDRPM